MSNCCADSHFTATTATPNLTSGSASSSPSSYSHCTPYLIFLVQTTQGASRDFLMQRLTSISRSPVNVLEFLLKQCYARSACQKTFLHRHYATASSTSNTNPESPSIAVLGGGITGLASAYFLSRDLPNAKITLFEASSRLGGWLHSTSVDVGSGNVIFEQGPRNLRPTMPNGLITLNLV